MARAQGLSSLPHEVLGLIFTCSANGCNNWEMAFRLSAVCRRFRTVVLSTPRLWSTFTSHTRKQEILDICLERSQNVGLHLAICHASAEFISTIRQHRKRWESLSVAVVSGFSEMMEVFSYDDYDGLPRLQSIILGNDVSAPALNALVWMWSISARNLRHLKVSILPPSGSQCNFPESLTHLDFKVYQPGDFETIALSTQELISLLKSAPLLEVINLNLTELSGNYEFPHCQSEEKVVFFPRVERATLSFAAEDGLKPLLSALYFPNVKNLAINVDEKGTVLVPEDDEYLGPLEREIDDIRPGLDLVANLLAGDKIYSQLTTLSLKFGFEEEYECEPGLPLNEYLIVEYAHRCPALQHLTLDCTILIDYLHLPSLYNLTLLNCTLKNAKWLVDFKRDLREDGTWSSFGRLQLLGCRWADRNDSLDKLREMFGSKLDVFRDHPGGESVFSIFYRCANSPPFPSAAL